MISAMCFRLGKLRYVGRQLIKLGQIIKISVFSGVALFEVV